MREVNGTQITEAVAELCIRANCYLTQDIKDKLNEAVKSEKSELAREILQTLVKNYKIAEDETCPICQDTGMAVVFVEIGQEVHVKSDINVAINEGVKLGYSKGYLRNSIVMDPINRINTGDNTPAIIHYDLAPGDKIKITLAPKGFGSENMSAVKMLKPSDGIQGVKEFILETVITGGSNPCPPIILGVGIGGTMEKAALIAKRALTRDLYKRNDNAFWADFENEMLEAVNKTGIGASGFGGSITCLGINVEVYATHIAGLPVAVNMSCHATRHAEMII